MSNITITVLDSSGQVVAHYEYGPFGELIRQSGGFANTNRYRFSTKPIDPETGLYYYGHRYYDPVIGGWISRDPLQEEGGMNLYGFVGNDSVNGWDYLGLKCDPLDMAAAGIRGAAVGFAKAYAFKKVVTTGAKILVSQSVPGVGQAAGIAMVGWEVISLGHTGYQIYVNSGTIKAEVMSVLEDGKLKQ